MRRRTTTLLTALAALGGCASTGLHPQAPPRGGLATVPDPTPSRVVVHASLSGAALQQLAEQKLPPSGSGDVSLVGKRVHYRWERKPVEVQFDRGRVLLTTRVVGHVQLFGDQTFPVEVTSAGEPVVTPDYQARLQSTTVEVKAQGPLDAINHAIETRIHDLVAARLKQIKVDLKPIVAAAYARLAKPISLVEKRSFYGTGACAELKVAAVEAGPTVLADGIEKDLAVVVLPSVTMPCAADANAGRTLPRLANVAALPSGPFEVTIPISATYDEFARALDNAIGGKLQFSRRYPDTFLEKPEVYPSNDALVIKFLVGGFVRVA